MANLKLRPLGDQVLLEPIEQAQSTTSGIVLPETAKEKPQEGKVLAVGPGSRNEEGQRQPLEVSVGDRVLFAKYSGTEFKLRSSKYLIMRERDILGIVQ